MKITLEAIGAGFLGVRRFTITSSFSGADPENSERGGRVPHPPAPPNVNSGFFAFLESFKKIVHSLAVQQGARRDNICVIVPRHFKPKETPVTFGVNN